jgi:hypothetical protein
MSHLYEVLGRRVDRWRAEGCPVEDAPAIAEIFEWASDPDTGATRYLRRPQLRALETYWYLRLVDSDVRHGVLDIVGESGRRAASPGGRGGRHREYRGGSGDRRPL